MITNWITAAPGTDAFQQLRRQFAQMTDDQKETVYTGCKRHIASILRNNNNQRDDTYVNTVNKFTALAGIPLQIRRTKTKGIGLFATKQIPPSKKKCVTYFQRAVDQTRITHDMIGSEVMLQTPTDIRALGQFTNEASTNTELSQRRQNAIIRRKNKRYCLKNETKAVRKGQEIVTYYGSSYDRSLYKRKRVSDPPTSSGHSTTSLAMRRTQGASRTIFDAIITHIAKIISIDHTSGEYQMSQGPVLCKVVCENDGVAASLAKSNTSKFADTTLKANIRNTEKNMCFYLSCAFYKCVRNFIKKNKFPIFERLMKGVRGMPQNVVAMFPANKFLSAYAKTIKWQTCDNVLSAAEREKFPNEYKLCVTCKTTGTVPNCKRCKEQQQTFLYLLNESCGASSRMADNLLIVLVAKFLQKDIVIFDIEQHPTCTVHVIAHDGVSSHQVLQRAKKAGPTYFDFANANAKGIVVVKPLEHYECAQLVLEQPSDDTFSQMYASAMSLKDFDTQTLETIQDHFSKKENKETKRPNKKPKLREVINLISDSEDEGENKKYIDWSKEGIEGSDTTWLSSSDDEDATNFTQILKTNGAVLIANYFTNSEIRCLYKNFTFSPIRKGRQLRAKQLTWKGINVLSEQIKATGVVDKEFYAFVDPDRFIYRSSEKGRVKVDTGPLSLSFEDALKNEKLTQSFYVKLQALLQEVKSMNSNCKHHAMHFMFTFHGQLHQNFHYDAFDEAKTCYFTILIPLSNDQSLSGGTEFKDKLTTIDHQTKKIAQIDENTCVNMLRSALIFKGNILHRGRCNLTNLTRIFLFITVTSTLQDRNDGK